MQSKIFQNLLKGFTAALILTGCAAQPAPAPTSDINAIAEQLAAQMFTQTAEAYIPPTPSSTPTPPATDTPQPTQTASPIIVQGNAPCYSKPDVSAPLTSNISDTKIVELLGVGSASGWYVIQNPYFNSPCWMQEKDLRIDSNFDFSAYPTVMP